MSAATELISASPSTPTTLAWGALALVGLGGSALCSGLETGIYTLNHARLTLRAHAHDAAPRHARLLREIERPERPLAALLLGNNLFNYFGVLGLTALLAGAGLTERAIVAVNILALTPLLLVFAESLPKDLMRQRADDVVPRLAPLLFALEGALKIVGVLPVVLAVARLAARLTGGRSMGGLADRQRQRVATLLKEGGAHGILTPRQSALIDGALEFGRARVADVMTPWGDTPTLADSATRAEAWERLSSAARVVLVDGAGLPRGVLESVDLRARADDAPRSLARAALRVAPEESVRESLRAFRRGGVLAAIVESGGRVLGIVTMDDLIHPLTGAVGGPRDSE